MRIDDLRKHCINACSSESLRCAVLEDSPNPMLCLAFCVPRALRPTWMWEVQAFVRNERSRFILLGDLFSDSLSIGQLLELNKAICRRIDELRAQQDLQILIRLRVGQQVTFHGREGPIVGIVTRINRKSVVVVDEDGTKQYRVSPSLLTPLNDVK